MTKRQNRMVLVATLIAGAILAVTLLLQALESNANYFYSPTAVAEGKAPIGKSFRLGGLVVATNRLPTKEPVVTMPCPSLNKTGKMPVYSTVNLFLLSVTSKVDFKSLRLKLPATTKPPNRKLLPIGALPSATAVGE
jgi:hypothetical protein